jgi:large subunit ribosomal protein L15
MFKLNNLKSPKGANKKTKRLGRGQGSGRGTQAGKGNKGQDARSGGGVRLGFEGNNLPLYMRLPKRGFKNYLFKKVFAVVSLGTIQKHFESEEITKELLISKGLIKGQNKNKPVKILVKGDFNKAFTFKGIDQFSKTAEALIKKVGGKIN